MRSVGRPSPQITVVPRLEALVAAFRLDSMLGLSAKMTTAWAPLFCNLRSQVEGRVISSRWRSKSSAVTRLRFFFDWVRFVSVVVAAVRFLVCTSSNWTLSTRPAASCVPKRWRRWASVVSIGALTMKRERVESGSGIRGSCGRR